jgi:hypothetical protein
LSRTKYVSARLGPGPIAIAKDRHEAVLDVLRRAAQPLTRQELFDALKRKYTRSAIDCSVDKLRESHRIVCVRHNREATYELPKDE